MDRENNDTRPYFGAINLAIILESEREGATPFSMTQAVLSALNEAGCVVEQGWQPIETAPKDGTRILLFVPPYGASTGHYSPARSNWGEKASLWIAHAVLNKEAAPTHWMPLPEPPLTAAQGDGTDD